jgi:hypothetical protein
MPREAIDVAVIIPDASPVLTLARIGRPDVLGGFSVPVRVVDQVHDEIARPDNDRNSDVPAGLRRLHNNLEIVESMWASAIRPGAISSRALRA